MIDVTSGDTVITMNGVDYLFRPSLKNMAKLGDPKEIIEIFGQLHGAGVESALKDIDGFRSDTDNLQQRAQELMEHHGTHLVAIGELMQFQTGADIYGRYYKTLLKQILPTAINILWCCYEGEEDLTPIVGGYKSVRGKLLYSIGKANTKEIIILARHMMKHGVVGDGEKKEDGEYSDEFNPAEFVEVAVDLLKMPFAEAEQLTMTRLIRMLDRRSGKKKEKEISREEYAALKELATKGNK